ncbi:hypothetical protein [Flavobacterium sp.]|jgi:hypothetical protein|uniref:hypothetical protein n=1 Tax=Flavobacterium sp. TaxID=239 RepID=UPI0037BFBEDB
MWGRRIPDVDRVIYANLIIDITGFTDSEELGLASKEDGILGTSLMTIEPKYVTQDLIDCLRSGYEGDDQDYPELGGDFETYNTDIQILILRHYLNVGEEVFIQWEINHFYWLCHDLVHAEEHAGGCVLQVGPQLEAYTFLEAFRLAEEHNLLSYCLLTEEEAHQLINSYNQRFKRDLKEPLPPSFFNRFLKPLEHEPED